MPFTDRIVENPRTFTIQNNPDGTVTLIPAPGTILQEGTPVNATNLNAIEESIATHEEDATTAHGINTKVEKPATATADRIAVFDTDQNKIKDSGKAVADLQSNAKSQGNASYTDSISAGGTLTKNIAIGAGKTHGKLVIANTGFDGRYSIMVFFGTDNTKSLVVGYHHGSSNGAAWSRRLVGTITDTTARGYGVCGESGTPKPLLRINECYINGSNLTIIFENTDVSARSLSVAIDWEVW